MKKVNNNISSDNAFYLGSTAEAIRIAFADIVENKLGQMNTIRFLVVGDKSMFAGIMPSGTSFLGKDDITGGILNFPDCMFDAVIIFNALESVEQLDDFMHEVWRVLEDGGKVLFFAPSPISFWRMDKGTPIGSGLSFCSFKLWFRLACLRFTPLKVQRALLLPPRFYDADWAKKEAKYQLWLAPLAGAFALLCEKRLLTMPPKVEVGSMLSQKFTSSSTSTATVSSSCSPATTTSLES